MREEEGQPIREVRLRGGPLDGQVLWWSGGPDFDVPSLDGVTLYDPAQARGLPRPLVFQDVPYRQSAEDAAVFDYAGSAGDG